MSRYSMSAYPFADDASMAAEQAMTTMYRIVNATLTITPVSAPLPHECAFCG